ncbi:hypothetical protein [Bacillus sp. RC242]|uniref:hypothetical protein n=1 Tax=Bacillus sp. RC242 TaxID=3156286 RepID=UPI00384F3BDF
MLYEIYHLLDELIISEIENIEGIHERQRVFEEGENEQLIEYYQVFLKIIKKECEDWRESVKNNKKAI